MYWHTHVHTYNAHPIVLQAFSWVVRPPAGMAHYWCSLCDSRIKAPPPANRQTQLRVVLQRHALTFHYDSLLYQCLICAKKTSTDVQAFKHIDRTHQVERPSQHVLNMTHPWMGHIRALTAHCFPEAADYIVNKRQRPEIEPKPPGDSLLSSQTRHCHHFELNWSVKPSAHGAGAGAGATT